MSIFSRAFNSLTNVLSSGVRMSASPRLLGRYSGGAGAGQEIQLGAGFSFAGDTLNYTAGGATTTDGLTTSDGTAAAVAGKLGEYFFSTSSGLSLTNGNLTFIATVELTAGDWDVEGMVHFIGVGSTSISDRRAGTSPSNSAFVEYEWDARDTTPTTLTPSTHTLSLSRKRVRVSVTTNYYLLARASFSAGNVTATGNITARRVR